MTIQQIVEPSFIEQKLFTLWHALAKENKTRASLFNLIVFSKVNARIDFVRDLVQKVVERFPCRTLFISHDPAAAHPYLKTAISVVTLQDGGQGTACDQIDIGVGGTDLERVPFLILPHLIPDLPIYLLWAEEPNISHPLFAPLSMLAHRCIFDSESSTNLFAFAHTLLELKEKKHIDLADLNWARIEGWRDVIASIFSSAESFDALRNLTQIEITYNAHRASFFCDHKIQATYIAAWLASCLQWDCRKIENDFTFCFDHIHIHLRSETWDQLEPGAVTRIVFRMSDGYLIEAQRIKEQPHRVRIEISSPEKCEIPHQFVLERAVAGQSLVKEVSTKGTSTHYLAMLQQLTLLHHKIVC